MTPTMKLRFVTRRVKEVCEFDESESVFRLQKILQQWWESPYVGETGEWRDVEVEDE